MRFSTEIPVYLGNGNTVICVYVRVCMCVCINYVYLFIVFFLECVGVLPFDGEIKMYIIRDRPMVVTER